MSAPSTEELRTAIAALFLGEGLESMSEEQMIAAISIKRRWFLPDGAKAMIKNALKAGLLTEENGIYSPSFDYREIEIPFGYYPPAEIGEIEEEKLMDMLITELKLDETEVKEALSMDYNLMDEVKILLWAAMHGREYMHLIDEVEKGIKGII